MTNEKRFSCGWIAFSILIKNLTFQSANYVVATESKKKKTTNILYIFSIIADVTETPYVENNFRKSLKNLADWSRS